MSFEPMCGSIKPAAGIFTSPEDDWFGHKLLSSGTMAPEPFRIRIIAGRCDRWIYCHGRMDILEAELRSLRD
jgi:hypothetical protein